MKFKASIVSDFSSAKVRDTLYPERSSDEPFDLIYSNWYYDFGFCRRVTAGEWNEQDGSLMLPLYPAPSTGKRHEDA